MTTMTENVAVDQWFRGVKTDDELQVIVDGGPQAGRMWKKAVNAHFLWDWLDANRDLYFTTIVELQSPNPPALVVVFHHPPVHNTYGLKVYKDAVSG